MNKLAALMVLMFLLPATLAQTEPHPQDWEGYNDLDYNSMQTVWQDSLQHFQTNPGPPGFCDTDQDARDLGLSMLANSVIAIAIMVFAGALAYMGGNFLQLPNLIAIAKQELNETVVTAIVAMLFFLLIATSSLSAQQIFGIDLFHASEQYSFKMLEKVSTYSSILITANIALNSVYSLYIPIGPIRKAMTIQLGPALRPLIDGVSFSLQFLITTYGEWMAFIFMFCFIKKWFLPLFFPVGLLLRAFPQTRGGGNALIGVSVALLTIYPGMFYLDSLIFEQQFPDGGMGESFQTFYDAVIAIVTQFTLGGALAMFGAISLLYVSPFIVTALVLASYLFFDVLWNVIHLIVMFSILLPVMNIFVTLSFAREISRLLGTEISISAFAKLI